MKKLKGIIYQMIYAAVKYGKPQESGNRTDVRWATLTNNDGVGLLAVGMTAAVFLFATGTN